MMTQRNGIFTLHGKPTILAALFLLLTLMSFSFLACAPKAETTEPVQEEYESSILVGLIPEQNVFKQMERYKPLAEYISRKAEVGIELKILSRYGNIITNFNTLALDGAFFGSFTYALAHKKIAVETVVRPESHEGISSYYGMIFVRKDGGISSAAQMKGKRFAFVDKATTAGYLLPLKYFSENGIDDYNDYFSETYFTGTHEDAVYDVLNGKADIGAAKNTIYYRLAGIDSRILDELEILAESPAVPENALALRQDLDETTRSRLKEAFLGMSEDPEGRKILESFGAARFIETTNEDYAPVFEYAESAGIDLATYDWMNE
jgi:phosphonate transport system substrate-binding protein